MTGFVGERSQQDTPSGETVIDAPLRRTILAAAVEELRKWGFERFSVEMVADRAALDLSVILALWDSPHQLIADALIEHCDLMVRLPDTGSLRNDLIGLLASIADYFNFADGRSLLRTGVIGPRDWATTGVRDYLWKISVDAMRVVFERAERRREIRPGIDHNVALQLAVGPLFLRGLYSNDPIDTKQFCTLVADLVWRAVRRDELESFSGREDPTPAAR